MSKFDRLETDLIFERHTRHLQRRSGRIVCDGDEDEVDGWVIPTPVKHLPVGIPQALKIVMSHIPNRIVDVWRGI